MVAECKKPMFNEIKTGKMEFVNFKINIYFYNIEKQL